MSKVVLVQMVYNAMRYIPKSIESMVNQTYPETEVVVVINGNNDGSKEYIQKHFPQVKVIDPGENLKFVRGCNMVFRTIEADFFQLVNNDLWLEPNYVEEMVKVFNDPKVAASQGKIYQYNFATDEKSKLLDSTGIIYSKSGSGRSRGQHQVDIGQFNDQVNLLAVDGAAPMFRKTALEDIKYQRSDGSYEYFDEDFDMYWDDSDISMRFINSGYKCQFVPSAIGYHGRTASSSVGGYKKVFEFIKHHNKLAPWIRKNNFKNHIFLFIKNSPKWYAQFFIREFFMFGFILIFEIKTLSILPTFFRQLPLIWKKRRYIQAHRKISVSEMEKLFS